MKLIEIKKPNVVKQITLKEKLEKIKFTVELTGVDLLALRAISSRIGGAGALRTALSNDAAEVYRLSRVACELPVGLNISDLFDTGRQANIIQFKSNILENTTVDE